MSHLGLRFCQCQRSCQSKNCDWQNPRWYELKLICKLLDTQGIQVLGKGGQVLGKGIHVLGQGVQEPGYSMLPSTADAVYAITHLAQKTFSTIGKSFA